MKTTTILKIAFLTAALVQPLQAEAKSSSLLVGKTLRVASQSGKQPATKAGNTKGPLVTPAEAFAEEVPTEELIQKALESEQATTVYVKQVNDALETLASGGTVSLEAFRTNFRDALNSFFGL
ncbi:hypothetical protein [Roseibacillus persicicus]|uniref:hypothetical protein n=1 Tax=Roseibacillus persicicus TaxID=454148 RepID=UPI00280DABF1|nr:hypothetical protein [Roseibacillus persicicus]MDQ8190607.1 hypothetical protein [Roseibacillus persicicus]